MADDTSIPHFFLPLIPGFLTKFCIPKAFLKHLKLAESNNGKESVAVLKDRNSDGDKAWPVKVDSDGRRFMNGWKEFAQDHSLRVGDFLIFRYHGGFVFDVLVLDPVTACDRSFSVDTLVQSESVHPETNEHVTESKSVRNSPSKDDALVFDPVSVDPLIRSECVHSEITDQCMTESEQVPSPSKGNALVFDPVSVDQLIQSECVHSEIIDQHMTESEQVPSPSPCKGNALVFDPVSADPLIQSEFIQLETSKHITESEPVPSPSKGDAIVFDPLSADPLIQSEVVHSEFNEQHMKEQGTSPCKDNALVFDPLTADLLIQSESIYSETNGNEQQHITESEPVPSPSKGNPTISEQVPCQASSSKGDDPLMQSEPVNLETNDQHNAEERVEFKPSGRPYFRKCLTKSSLGSWGGHHLPKNFARENNLALRDCNVTIIDQKDRSWTVYLTHWETGKCQPYLASGWIDFRVANGLKTGDTVVFEVIDSGSDPVIKFYKLS